ncbi:MAG: hypothetical protein AVO35_11700 [Candidatus Aegiribacteria sp. MLS_C]|nr:MAG: hypothetical protein AVO35_11700 [Candidatus Aegiribacteria sp. MLS_C]
MRLAAVPGVVLVSVLSAGQVFYMDLEQAAGMAENIFVAEMGESAVIAMDYLIRVEYEMDVLQVLRGTGVNAGGLFVFYTFDVPRSYVDEDGMEVWESPMVTGSGIETAVEEGDTVIVFAYGLHSDLPAGIEVLRMEPLDSLAVVMAMLDGSEP